MFVCFSEEWGAEGNLSLIGRSVAAAVMNGGWISPSGTVRLKVIDVIKGIWLWVTCQLAGWQQRCIYVFVPLPGLAALLSQQIRGSSFWLVILSGWPQTPMNHLKVSHPSCGSDDSLTDVSLVLSGAFFSMLLDLLWTLFLWVIAWAYAGFYMCLFAEWSAKTVNLLLWM